jgi:hypothetical protein
MFSLDLVYFSQTVCTIYDMCICSQSYLLYYRNNFSHENEKHFVLFFFLLQNVIYFYQIF